LQYTANKGLQEKIHVVHTDRPWPSRLGGLPNEVDPRWRGSKAGRVGALADRLIARLAGPAGVSWETCTRPKRKRKPKDNRNLDANGAKCCQARHPCEAVGSGSHTIRGN